MPKGLHRRYGLRHLHFITCSCYRRLPFLPRPALRIYLSRFWAKCGIATASLWPATSSCPITFTCSSANPLQGTPSTVLQVLKQRVSRRFRRKPRKKISSQQLALPFRQAIGLIASLLAAALLRFQRLESDQVRRKASLHAHESDEEKIGGSSERLALEQFFFLREEGNWTGSHRYRTLIGARNSKSPPLKSVKDGAPQLQIQRPGHPRTTILQSLGHPTDMHD